MILPQSYSLTLLVLIFGAICWGSWVVTYRLAGNWRYELYYLDWIAGAIAAALVVALTLGSLGFDGFSFRDDILISGRRNWLYALIAGVIFNLGNMLLLAAASVSGLAVAFLISGAVALPVWAITSYLMHHNGPITLVLLGCLLSLGAAVCAMLLHRGLVVIGHEEQARAGKVRSTRRPSAAKAILLAAGSGVLMGAFVPFVEKAREGEIGLGPYSLAFLLLFAAAVSTLLFDLLLMNLPVEGEPLEIFEYIKGGFRPHIFGWIGGALFAVALIAVLIPGKVPEPMQPGTVATTVWSKIPPLLSALWGILAWRELRKADSRSTVLALLAILLFAGGIALLAFAPLYAAPL